MAGPMLVAWLCVRSWYPLGTACVSWPSRPGANARHLTYMLLERAHDDLTCCPGESHGDGLGRTRGDALVLRVGPPGAFRRLAQDRIVFNVYEGLEMHGERG